jgi:predicted Rossmann fold flavoprotein
MRHITPTDLSPTPYDCIILGAGAAGMMCAGFASTKGDTVLVVDHAKRAGDKIRISGGGRCNFTNIYTGPENFISQNKHFVKSALARYTQWDFIELISKHRIAYHEKTLGQLFCDDKATQIIDMLHAEAPNAQLALNTSIDNISHDGALFQLTLGGHSVQARNVVVATGGKSIPKMGATGIGYHIAEQFGVPVLDTRPGLVPLTFGPQELDWITPLAGTALDGRLTANGKSFEEALLFTHRGISGPAVLQVSSYWLEGNMVYANLLPNTSAFDALRKERAENGRRQMSTALATLFPKKLAMTLAENLTLSGNLADQSDKALQTLADMLHAFPLKPNGSEGYRTAEVTLGGVDTNALNSKTMEAKNVKGLYFIGEVVDVTGWLGGFNFQWAWSSAAACGRAIADQKT